MRRRYAPSTSKTPESALHFNLTRSPDPTAVVPPLTLVRGRMQYTAYASFTTQSQTGLVQRSRVNHS